MHFGPIVIHPDVVAGENLTLLHRVTLGYAKSGLPRIGDNVSIGAGAVVTRDIPANCTAVGVPAKPIPDPGIVQNGQKKQQELICPLDHRRILALNQNFKKIFTLKLKRLEPCGLSLFTTAHKQLQNKLWYTYMTYR